MDVKKQLESGVLVSPKTKKSLKLLNSEWLVAADEREKYRLHEGRVPILLGDSTIDESSKMIQEYANYGNEGRGNLYQKTKSLLLKYKQDYRNEKAISAFQDFIKNQSDNALLISIGGGPTRAHPKLVNLNIAPFPNVEIVADAHSLPYRDSSVDGLHCEAVLEHLRDPDRAVKEMYRVLKPGGKVFSCTPFLQPYHGYPHHYQNFTLTGHQYLFSSQGFQILEAGTCVGPVHTMLVLTEMTLTHYFPPYLAKPISLVWRLAGRFLYPLDRWVNDKDNAYLLASTTYLVAVK